MTPRMVLLILKVLGTLLVVGIVAVAVVLLRRPAEPERPILAPAIVRRADSLASYRATDSVTVDSLKRKAAVKDTSASRAAERARAQEAAARRLKATADSLASEAATSDSVAALWKAAYETRTAEAESLWVANAALVLANTDLRSANLDLAVALDKQSVRMRAIDKLNADIRAAIDSAEVARRCRVGVGPLAVRCPSRAESAGLAVLGWEAGKALIRGAIRGR